MFSKIMVPVDLVHPEQLSKALSVSANLAKLYEAEVHLVGVTQSSPTEVAATPEAHTGKLDAFAKERSAELGVEFKPHAELSHDPAADLESVLGRTATSLDADLIVMASHIPGYAEYVFSSNAGYLASHAKISVFVVR